MNRILYLLACAAFVACNSPKQEKTEVSTSDSTLNLVYSLDGKILPYPMFSAAQQAKLDSNLAVANKNFESESSEMNYIWLGRRLAYLSRYDEAIAIFKEGIAKYPNSYKLYRHLGHRYISTRQFDSAVEVLAKAAELLPEGKLELEPDGIPNALNQPLSTTQFNIWYHLGLAHYLLGDYEKAKIAYAQCLAVSDNDDLLVATYDWLYMTYKRLGENDKALAILNQVTDNMQIIENDSYYKRLLMYNGKLAPEELLTVNTTSGDYELSLATQGYGVGNYFLMKGDTTKAKQIFTDILKANYWSAFGYIAAEADMAILNQ